MWDCRVNHLHPGLWTLRVEWLDPYRPGRRFPRRVRLVEGAASQQPVTEDVSARVPSGDPCPWSPFVGRGSDSGCAPVGSGGCKTGRVRLL